MNRARARRRFEQWSRYCERYPSLRNDVGKALLRWSYRAHRPTRRWVR